MRRPFPIAVMALFFLSAAALMAQRGQQDQQHLAHFRERFGRAWFRITARRCGSWTAPLGRTALSWPSARGNLCACQGPL
jgi:hypothetical protein